MAAVVYHNFQMGSAQVSFSVLVWGPSRSSDDRFSEKRKQVKESIENNGHKAFFSEELTFDEQYTVPVNVQERAQLEMIDLVVCLGTDFGAMQEAQEFADERPQHFLLWLSSRGKGTYSESEKYCDWPARRQFSSVIRTLSHVSLRQQALTGWSGGGIENGRSTTRGGASTRSTQRAAEKNDWEFSPLPLLRRVAIPSARPLGRRSRLVPAII
jgi:hypothetical protein